MIQKLIQIGNSKGIRIPASVLKSKGFTEEVYIELQKDALIIRPHSETREGWKEAFGKEESDGKMILGDIKNEWDDNEWTW